MSGRSLFLRAGLAGVVATALTASLVGAGGSLLVAEPAAAADAGMSSSAVTVKSRDYALSREDAPFPDLEVTVSQTRDLVSQGIRVSWKNGEKSTRPDAGQGGTNFLQIAQCWGEDPANPGHPDRRTCQYGGGRQVGSDRDGFTELDAVAAEDRDYVADLGSYAYAAIPFVATNPERIVDEKKAPADRVIDNLMTVDGVVRQKPDEQTVDMANNPFFSAYTTNEVKWAAAGADGTGSVPFEVQTAMQSTALGCGAPVAGTGGATVGQSCWLVIIPRGTSDSGVSAISRSGLYWDAWEHHLAVKLEFKPLGVRCQIGQAERQLAGSELISGAIASWQPALCAGAKGAPFVLGESSEADALARAAGTRPSPLALTSRHLDPARIGGAKDPLVYAPVAIAGVALTFAIDREPRPDSPNREYQERAGLPFTEMRLTPRLVAKLLTSSYLDALPNGADKTHLGQNPRTIVWDPEFRAVNDPEWSEQVIIGASVADALVPSGRSDAAARLWEYVMADAEARAWLDGADDGNGMIVNPWYTTNAAKNPNGVAMSYPLDNFPKADPVERPVGEDGRGPVNLVTWRPYTHSLSNGAYDVLRGDGLILGSWNGLSIPPKYEKSVRELFGSQRVIGVSSTPATEQYQTVTASLRNPAGQFVKPTQASMSAAAAAMTPVSAQPNVMSYDFASDAAKAASTAYPLTMPIYAALNPQQTDAEQRAVYANLIRYAASDGQRPGTDIGQLPPGYAPLPGAWVARALTWADVIERGGVAPAAPPTGGSSSPGAGSVASGGGSGAAPTVPAAAPAQGGTSVLTVDPVATGEAAGPLTGTPTAADPTPGPLAAALPIGLVAGLAAALAVLILPSIRRRA